jgi:purine-binding chemotaxis protein CheW
MEEPFILFRVDKATYGVRSAEVQQVEMIEEITPVPNAPSYIDGIVSLRGQIVPVINLRRRFALEQIPYDMLSRLVVVKIEGRVIGLAVDTAREFVKIDPELIENPPETLVGPGVEYLEGIVPEEKRLILILNLAMMLSQREKGQLDQDAVLLSMNPEDAAE